MRPAPSFSPRTALLVVGVLLGALLAIRSHTPAAAEPEGADFLMHCVNVSPGAAVSVGGDRNYMLVSQPTHGRLTGPDTIMHVGFVGCLVGHGCLLDLDFDDDEDADAADVAIFVSVLLGIDDDPLHVEQSDYNCDGQADGDDVQPFVDALLG